MKIEKHEREKYEDRKRWTDFVKYDEQTKKRDEFFSLHFLFALTASGHIEIVEKRFAEFIVHHLSIPFKTFSLNII